MLGDTPLPGLDGNGRLCLKVRGVRVDDVTGAVSPVESVWICNVFAYEFRLPVEVGPFLRLFDGTQASTTDSVSEIGIVRVGAGAEARAGSNTLVLHLDAEWNDEAAEALLAGLEGCRREGAGLLVVVLFKDGALALSHRNLSERLLTLAAALPAPLLVTEDVRAGWSKGLSISSGTAEPAWRLLDATGMLSWAHNGQTDAETLTSVLDERLVSSRPAEVVRIEHGKAIGDRIPVELGTVEIEIENLACPPLPLTRSTGGGSKVLFLQTHSSSSLAHIRHLRSTHTSAMDHEPLVAIVLDGANREEAEKLRVELRIEWPIIADPTGAITRRAGVKATPTIMTLDRTGTITAHAVLGDDVTGNPHRTISES